MIVLAGLRCSHCACLQGVFPFAGGYSMSLGLCPANIPMTWDIRYDRSDMTCLQIMLMVMKQAGRQASKQASRQAGKQPGRQASKQAS